MAAGTATERYFEDQLKDPEYRRAYKAAKARIRKTDALVRALDERRVARDMTKAELARLAGMQPEAVRRLFTMESPNPTAGTLLALADALDMEVVARPKQRAAQRTKSTPPRRPPRAKVGSGA